MQKKSSKLFQELNIFNERMCYLRKSYYETIETNTKFIEK